MVWCSSPSHGDDALDTDLDLSDLCPPRAEADSSFCLSEDSFASPEKEAPSLVHERKFIVFESCLDQLLEACRSCAAPNTHIDKTVQGSSLQVSTLCRSVHTETWCSQPVIRRKPVGNILVAAAILFTGCSIKKALRMLSSMGIACFCYKTFFIIQKAFLLPAIEKLLILLDVSPDQSMMDEGLAREVINRVQKLRKKARLVPTDAVVVYTTVSPADHPVAAVVASHQKLIEGSLRVPLRRGGAHPEGDALIIQEVQELKGAQLKIVIVKDSGGLMASESLKDSASVSATSVPKSKPKKDSKQAEVVLGKYDDSEAAPFCRFVNVELCGGTNGPKSRKATVLLENPIGQNIVDLARLQYLVRVVFGLPDKTLDVYRTRDRMSKLTSLTSEDVKALHGKTLYVQLS
ncbi:hypothetical protein ISCGN_012415 [Ixodes scapularis]